MILGIAGSVEASESSRRAISEQEKKRRLISDNNARNENIFNKQYWQDIAKRTDVLNMMKMLSDNQDKQQAREMSQLAVAGATPEQKLAMQENNRKSFADAWSNVVSNASTLKDKYLDNWQNYMNQYYRQRLGFQDELAGIHRNTSNQWSQMAVNAFKSGTQAMGSGFEGVWKNAGGSSTISPAGATSPNMSSESDIDQLYHG